MAMTVMVILSGWPGGPMQAVYATVRAVGDNGDEDAA